MAQKSAIFVALVLLLAGIAEAPTIAKALPDVGRQVLSAIGLSVAPKYGTIQDVYRHSTTGVEIHIPQGWRFERDASSSGGGEAALFNSGSQSYFVWFISQSMKVEDISNSLDREVELKRQARQEREGASFRIRPGTQPVKWVSGNFQAIAVAFDYGDDQSNGEYGIWLRNGTTFVYFRARCPVDQLPAAQSELATLVEATKLP